METIYCGNGEEKKVVVVEDMEKYNYCTQLDRGDKVIIIDDYDNTKAYVFRKPLCLGAHHVGYDTGMFLTSEIPTSIAKVINNDRDDYSLKVEFSNGDVQWISYAVVDHEANIGLNGVKFLLQASTHEESEPTPELSGVEEDMPEPPTYNADDKDDKDVLIHLLANECGKGEGSVWEIHECPYVVAQVDFGKFALVSLHTFNRWSSPKPFADLYKEIIDMQNHEGVQYLGLFKDVYNEANVWVTL